MLRFAKICLSSAMLAALTGCTPDYSPNTYSNTAVQQANKVEPAVVVGFRQVEISANGTVGAVTGGAAGGILGSQTGAGGISSALAAVGGSVVGSLVGTTIEHASGDTTGWEYIVRKTDGDLLSVTQREPAPIPLGQKVLVITGNQARIVPDYSVAIDLPSVPSPEKDKTDRKEMPSTTSAPVASSHQIPSTPPSESAAPPSSPTTAATLDDVPPASLDGQEETPSPAPASIPPASSGSATPQSPPS